MKINEDNLAPIIIDLNIKSKGEITESFLTILGHGIKTILRRMFWEDYGIPSGVKVRGTTSQLTAFQSAITHEKKYLDAISEYGLNDPKTYRNRAMLDTSVRKFERKTGLKWPFE